MFYEGNLNFSNTWRHIDPKGILISLRFTSCMNRTHHNHHGGNQWADTAPPRPSLRLFTTHSSTTRCTYIFFVLFQVCTERKEYSNLNCGDTSEGRYQGFTWNVSRYIGISIPWWKRETRTGERTHTVQRSLKSRDEVGKMRSRYSNVQTTFSARMLIFLAL